MSTKDEAVRDLLVALPYLRHAVSAAQKEGVPRLAILAENKDGSGRILARFDANFIADVATAIGAPEQTEQDTLNAKAREFLDKHGLSQK